MPNMVVILFWLGFGIAYAGAYVLPASARSWKITLVTLSIICVAGWLMMLVAAEHGYGRAWVEMPASRLLQVFVIAAGITRARVLDRSRQP